jgi:hypothetical protein
MPTTRNPVRCRGADGPEIVGATTVAGWAGGAGGVADGASGASERSSDADVGEVEPRRMLARRFEFERRFRAMTDSRAA